MTSTRFMTPEEQAAEFRQRARESLLQTTLPVEDPAVIFALAHLEGLDNAWTARNRAIAIRRFFDWCHARGRPVFDIRKAEAKIYATSLPDRLAPATKKALCNHAGAFYTDAIDARKCPSNPFARVGPKAVTNRTDTPSLTKREIGRVYMHDAARRRSRSYSIVQERNFEIFKAMVNLGPRRAEVVGLCWGDQIVESERTQWRILGKGGTYANTALSTGVEADLVVWRQHLEADAGRPMQPDEPIFPRTSSGGKRSFRESATRGRLQPLKPASLTLIFKDLLDKAEVGKGLKRYAPHAARATAITLAHEAGVTDRDIMLMSRHKTIANLYRYIRTPAGASPADSWSVELDPDEAPGIGGEELAP